MSRTRDAERAGEGAIERSGVASPSLLRRWPDPDLGRGFGRALRHAFGRALGHAFWLGLGALSLVAVAASPARAEGTTPADPHVESAAPVDLRPEVRIQRRMVEKKGHFAVFAGFAYLARGDFYYSPGVEVAACYYLFESLALELRGALFFSSPTDELKQVLAATGYLPDSRESRGALMVGARYTIGYAKIKLGASYVLHFEPQAFVDLGVHVASGPYTDVVPGPMVEVGLGFLLFFTPRLQARIDAGLTVGGEQRTSYVAVIGGYPVLALGMMF